MEHKSIRYMEDSAVPAAYELLQERELPDLGFTGFLLRHKKTGARVLLMPCADDNKVFGIGFRTPPEDSTGVAHIIEHTVLCGSEQYPVRDPFKLLIKGSLNTFLNAMTFPDKTFYPVASCNDRDFRNLMSVYLDAVFFPNIYREENIFRQEGWHYEIDPESGELTINGVVYNEMKGALSSPEEVMSREILSSLFPDTPYTMEYGGDPEFIPDLTYEAYLDFHRRWYHPSNSFILLYGNMDFTERLQYMHEAYLDRFEKLEMNTVLPVQPPFSGIVTRESCYAILEDEEEKNKTWLALNICLGQDTPDEKTGVALQILNYVLGGAEGAPLKKALRERGIGEDVSTSIDISLRQPYFSLVAQNTEAERQEEFYTVIREVLTELVKSGIDRRALAAGISYHEFRYREANFGSYPKGLIYGMASLDTWLHHEEDPWRGLNAGEIYRQLREDAENGYFEELVSRYLLDNPHASLLVMRPQRGLTDSKNEALQARLADIAASLTEEERAAIMEKEKALRAWQQKEDSPEDIARIPMLGREDLKREVQLPVNRPIDTAGTTLLAHEVFSGGIIYLRFVFDMKSLPERLYPAIPVLRTLMGAMDTAQYTYERLDQEIHIQTGGISTSTEVFYVPSRDRKYMASFILSVKTLPDHLREALSLSQEVLLRTDFSDTGRIREILEEERASLRYLLMSASHSTAITKAVSSFREDAVMTDRLSGQAFYHSLDALLARLTDVNDEVRTAAFTQLRKDLEETVSCLFRPENLLTDCVACEKDTASVRELLPAWINGLRTEECDTGSFRPAVTGLKEAYITPGEVQYVCRAGLFLSPERPYTGALRVLRILLSYDYLWPVVREKGGAYGCFCGFSASGNAFMVSYRDPHLNSTMEAYEKASEYIRSCKLDDKEMTRAIIGTISEMDHPMTPGMLGSYSLYCYLRGETPETLQRDRDQVLGCTEEVIHSLADYLDAILDTDALCVVGAEKKIRENGKLFDRIEKLF